MPHADMHVKQSVALVHLNPQAPYRPFCLGQASVQCCEFFLRSFTDLFFQFSELPAMLKHLPRLHYDHSVIGCHALDALHIGPAQHAQGLTCASFLFTQMESAFTLDISQHTISMLPECRSKALWRSRFAAVPGFCHIHLFAYNWVVPAICALGTYPDTTDMACLCPYFCTDQPTDSWGIFASSVRHSRRVLHVHGCDRPTSYCVQDRLRSLTRSLVGTGTPGAPPPSRPPPITINSYSNPFGPARGSAPHGSPRCGSQPCYFDGAASCPPGAVPCLSRGCDHGSMAIPYQPYSVDPSCRCKGSPSCYRTTESGYDLMHAG